MSLILEALRKSEAERQRGRAPGLFVEQVALRPVARSRTPAWAWVMGLLILALLGVLGWREVSRQAAPADLATAAQAAAATTQDIAQRPEVATPSQEVTPSPGPTTARNPAAAPAAAPRPSPAPVAAAPSLPPADTAPPVVAATPPPAPTDLPEQSLPTLGSLDAGTRAQLPPLKLSMHVFATEPAQRFVILDGRRLGEGASPAPGVVLEQIRRDGLVLSVNGQRLLLARP